MGKLAAIRFRLPLYKTAVHLFVGPQADFVKWHEKHVGQFSAQIGADGFVAFNQGLNALFVWIRKASLPVLVHELSHAADAVLRHAGVRDGSGESRAYLLEAMLGTALRRLGWRLDVNAAVFETELRESLHGGGS